MFLLLNLGIVLSRNECSTLGISSCALQVPPGASAERNTWMEQADKNDYRQLQTVYLSSGTLDKIVFFAMYATMDKVYI